MHTAVVANYCMATDLAEYLSQQHAVPFREMHGIVGRSVSKAIDEGRRVCDLTPEEVAEQARAAGHEMPVTADDIQAGTDPRTALERRANVGGASRERMAAWSRSRAASTSSLTEWVAEERSRTQAARAEVRSLAGG